MQDPSDGISRRTLGAPIVLAIEDGEISGVVLGLEIRKHLAIKKDEIVCDII